MGSYLISSLRISASSAPLRLLALNGQITGEVQRTQRSTEKTFQISPIFRFSPRMRDRRTPRHKPRNDTGRLVQILLPR